MKTLFWTVLYTAMMIAGLMAAATVICAFLPKNPEAAQTQSMLLFSILCGTVSPVPAIYTTMAVTGKRDVAETPFILFSIEYIFSAGLALLFHVTGHV